MTHVGYDIDPETGEVMDKATSERLNTEKLRELLAQKHKVNVTEDDPILMMGTVFNALMDDAEQSKLSRILAKELPNFMQPKVIHWREAMPLNPNGKIDRTALYRELTGEVV